MKVSESSQPYQDLANAIVQVAVQDYREALKEYGRVIHRLETVQIQIQEIDCFFKSGYLEQLTTISGSLIRDRLAKDFKKMLADDGYEPGDVRKMVALMVESLSLHKRLTDNELRDTKRSVEVVTQELNKMIDKMEGK